MTTVLRYAKAVVGAAAAGVSAYLYARSDGHVSADDVWAIIGAVLAGGGLVGATPNAPKKPAA